MGMFDMVTCEYPLPAKNAPKGGYRSKDTPSQACNAYTIRKDGTLWWNDGTSAQEAFCPLTGEFQFYGFPHVPWYMFWKGRHSGWLVFSAHFLDGRIQRIELIEDPK